MSLVKFYQLILKYTIMTKENMNSLRLELSIKCKNGIDFLLAAAIIWLGIGFIWTLDETALQKSFFTFYIGMLMFPLAYLFSRLLNTAWNLKNNPLNALGLQLNLAQLFYFPLLFFVLSKSPEFFVMAYAIITGAHFYLYSWYYKTNWFAIAAGVIAFGSGLLAALLPDQIAIIPFFMSVSLFVLSGLLSIDYQKKRRSWNQAGLPESDRALSFMNQS
jgi:hypothetical protein